MSALGQKQTFAPQNVMSALQHYRGAVQLIARLFVRFFLAFSNAIGKRETRHSLYSHGI
jgi:hypothetical protein